MFTTHTSRDTTPRQTVVVLGGGYAGVTAANRLAADRGLDVVLINPRDHFVERIRLHQWTADTGDPRHPYASVLAAGVRLIVDAAEHIDAAHRRVRLASGTVLGYDLLIYAVGSAGATTIPGAAEHALAICEWESAGRIRERIATLPERSAISVVGGGLTGVETAAELAGLGHRITLVAGGEITPGISPRARASTRATLRRLGVIVREHTVVHRIEETGVMVGGPDGDAEITGDLTVLAAGFTGPDLARNSGLSCDDAGRLRTHASLVSVDDTAIVGTGDAAVPDGVHTRMSCQAASQLGLHAAKTARAQLAGRPPTPAHPVFVSQCISLGREAATLQVTHLDDAPARTVVTGRAAVLVKEYVCRGTVWGLKGLARMAGRPNPAAVAEPVEVAGV
ncbi:FAD-dependent oxidoreductase [Gordonia sp. NB41Y]|uniref:NAD(P)/FAD-dependent oxidoreductase n=1 Tax=Gordonia sp. NB41Y TaxID=875808 RepID=UPI00273BD331|nr:FAD-dependent oxidoreductase [Gordonia sp. NB41Y]WLP90480.1 FAD-dependent oxidoreductase [Gordonia sp. NB41Y]